MSEGQGVAGTEQIVRVLALANALDRSSRGIRVREFADKHGCCVRKVYRDIDSLIYAGYPIVKDGDWYQLLGDWQPPREAGVNREEALALLVARELLGSLDGTGIGPALDQLWSKINSGRSDDIATSGPPPPLAVRSLSAFDYAEQSDTIATIKRAIEEQRVLRIVHQRADLSAPTLRQVEPGELYLDPGLECLFLMAWCQLRNQPRTFAVHRIGQVELLKTRFNPRPEVLSKNTFQNAFRAFGGDEVEEVRLRFAKHLAPEIAERRWHSSQQLEPGPDGSLLLSMHIAQPLELLRWIVGFGPDAVVEEPSWLSRRVAERHRVAVEVEPKASNDQLINSKGT